MAITTLDGMLAGCEPPRYFVKQSAAVGRTQTSWPMGGIPAAGGYQTGLNGAIYTGNAIVGQLPRTDPAGGLNAYVARLTFCHVTGTTGGWVMLADRIWDNSAIDVTSTGAQTIATPTWPSRDQVGGTTGVGVLLAVEVSATTGAGTPSITVSYTNTTGTSGRSATNIAATTATSAAGLTYLLSLQAGDVGVKSVQSIQLSATWTSGTINLVAFRPLTAVSLSVFAGSVDCITGCFPRVYNGAVPFMIYVLATAPSNPVTGTYIEAQG